ncbi:ABCC11 [Symbiodinium natans]|uniref:ABCC11 protein n=1 Tax=Symbiodinium natans TaxID=878477 RepID=A0A812PZJ3_9DINO|nr:ABCC11 [Symbiodinium natans]
MWRSFLPLATSAVALAQSTLPQTCPAGQCLREEAADENRAALGFVQTSLHWKLRDQRAAAEKERVAEVLAANLTISDAENPWVLAPVNGHCPLNQGLGVEVPFTVPTALKFKAFEWMGLIHKLRHCGFNQIKVLTDLLSKGEGVQHENLLAWKISLAWAVVVLALIIWSFLSVAMVPRKQAADTVKAGLADDEKAYAKGFFHYVSLGWVDELVGRYGKNWQAVIDDNEIVCNRRDDAFAPYVNFKTHWEAEVQRAGSVEKAWILTALYKTVGWKGAMAMVLLTFTEEIAGGVMSILGLHYFLNALESLDAYALQHPGEELSYLGATIATLVWIWGSPMVFRFLSIIATLVDGHYTQVCASGLASIVFHKALRTPASVAKPESREREDGDEEPDPFGNHKPNLVQILNVDIVDCWGGLIRDCLCVFVAPFSMFFLFIIMVTQISFSAIGGASYILPVMIMMGTATQIAMGYWKMYQVFLDARLKWLTESLLSVRTIKSLAWEKLAQDKLLKARDGEIYCAKMMAVMTGVMSAVAHTLPWGVLVITMWILLAEKGKGRVAAHEVMVVQRLIQALLANISQLSTGMGRFMVVPNSFNRIRRFLAQPDRPEGVVRQPAVETPNGPAIRVMGSFTYAGTKPVLKDLDLAVPQGELVGIIGRVGSGKSTFLQTLIGELHPLGGTSPVGFVEAPDTATGQIAYCSQVPWIFEGTLRENIVMNQQLHHDRYYKCIHAAGLSSDLQILPGGDQVTIGSFGIRLSGGQRARVALARAAYMEDAKIVLIDDPFASVDGPTGQHIFTELLLGSVMRGRTRLVVTQPDRARLQHFDRLILFEDGCVVETGAPAEVMETEAFKRIQQEQVDDDDEDIEVKAAPACESPQSVLLAQHANDEGGMILREEEVQENITWDSIWWWLKAAGPLNLLLLFGTVALQAIVELRESLVLAVWIDTKVMNPEVHDSIFIRRLVLVVGSCCVCIMLTFFASAHVGLTSARKLHESCVTSLLQAPVDRFFDKQPVGRLINRLSYDMKQVDETLVATGLTMAQFFAGFMTTQTFILSVMPRRVTIAALPVYAATMYFIYLYRGTAVPLVFHSKHALSSVQDLQAVVVGQCVSIRANGMLDTLCSCVRQGLT